MIPLVVHFIDVHGALVDRGGNLRLYRRRRWRWLPLRVAAFYPFGQWVSVRVDVDGAARVAVG